MRATIAIVTVVSLSLAIASQAVGQSKAKGPERRDYAEALSRTLYFFDRQRAGDTPALSGGAPLRELFLSDGADVGRDLSGGWFHDAGPVKYNASMAYAATMLGWGLIEYPHVYERTGQSAHLLDNLRQVHDYFLRCFRNDLPEHYEYYTQCGDPALVAKSLAPLDSFDAAELASNRPSFKIDVRTRGSDVAGHTSAALAVGSIVFRRAGDLAQADKLLEQARRMFAFADHYRGGGRHIGPDGRVDASAPYRSSRYTDKLVWGAIWLHLAERSAQTRGYHRGYLDKAETIFQSLENQSNLERQGLSMEVANVHAGNCLMLARLTDKKLVTVQIDRYLQNAIDDSQVCFGADCSSFRGKDQAANSFLALVWADWIEETGRSDQLRDFARRQADELIGSPSADSDLSKGSSGSGSERRYRVAAPTKPIWEDANASLETLASLPGVLARLDQDYGWEPGGNVSASHQRVWISSTRK